MNVFDYPMELTDYGRIIMRRMPWFLAPFVLITAIAVTVAFVLPAIFKSEATFLIERQTIPQNLVRTTVTGYIQEQIQQIRQRIVTYDNLVDLADSNNLYPEELESDPASVVRKLQERIEVEMEDVQSTDPNEGGVRFATIAFTVSVSAESPEDAQSLTNQLADRYLQEHREAREEAASDVTDFLGEEAERLQIEIADLEAQLAEFKQDELQQLPELMATNLGLFERTQQKIDQIEQNILTLEQQVDSTRAELSLTEPYREVISQEGHRVLTGAQLLSALTAEYLSVSSRYSSEHPDVKRLSREIRILSEQNGDDGRLDEIMSRLVNLQEQLRQARQRYDDSHPEIQDLERAIASVQRGLQSAVVEEQQANDFALPPDNPRYVALQSQLTAAEANLAAQRKLLAENKADLDEYEDRLFNTPVVERRYLSLSRGYQNAKAKFQELKDKQLEARLAQQLEAGENAQKFILASPGFLPRLPESPNRIGIIFLGAFFGLVVGLLVVVLVEYLDKTIRNAHMIINVVGAQPLATIPQMQQRIKAAKTAKATGS